MKTKLEVLHAHISGNGSFTTKHETGWKTIVVSYSTSMYSVRLEQHTKAFYFHGCRTSNETHHQLSTWQWSTMYQFKVLGRTLLLSSWLDAPLLTPVLLLHKSKKLYLSLLSMESPNPGVSTTVNFNFTPFSSISTVDWETDTVRLIRLADDKISRSA